MKREEGYSADIFKTFLGAAGAQAILLISFPIITRLYNPSAIGEMTIFTSILSIFSVIVCCRYDLAVILPSSRKIAVNLLGLCVTITGLFFIGTSILTFFCSNLILNSLNLTMSESSLQLLCLGVFLEGIKLSLHSWYVRERKFALIANIRIAESFVAAVSKIGFAVFIANTSNYLVLGHILGTVITVLIYTLSFMRVYQDQLKFLKLKLIGFGFLRYIRFLQFSTASGLLIASATHLTNILMAIFFSPAVLGLYALGEKLVQLPIGLLGDAISKTFFPRANEALRKDRLSTLIETTLSMLIQISLPPILFIMILGPDIVGFVFGDKWTEGGHFLRLVAPLLFFQFLFAPISTLFSVYEMQKASTIFATGLLISRIGAICVGGLFFQNIERTLLLLTASTSIVYIATLWSFFKISKSALWNSTKAPLLSFAQTSPLLIAGLIFYFSNFSELMIPAYLSLLGYLGINLYFLYRLLKLL